MRAIVFGIHGTLKRRWRKKAPAFQPGLIRLEIERKYQRARPL
jgi:hypothetical protein